MSEEEPTVEQLVSLIRGLAANGTAPPPPTDELEAILFETLREFLRRELPPAESLMGSTRDGTNLLPRYGWVMPWGREGSGKTSVLVDLLFHACAGLDWLLYPVARPLRVVAVVNEGIPGGLQDKLRQKIELWSGDSELVLDNLAIYVSPWGEFTFRDASIVEHAHAFVRDFGADYLALDPLHTLGTSGAGSPQETEEFKHMLRGFGLWDDLGIITAHHSNKNGMVSGDWARHPDTVLHLEKDGQNPATKVTLEKARPADPHELGVPVLLEWQVETLGYVRRTLDATREVVGDEELLGRVKEYLATRSRASLDDVKFDVQGARNRLAKVTREAVGRGEIVNESRRSDRFSLRLPLEGEIARVPEGASGGENLQTRMATEVTGTLGGVRSDRVPQGAGVAEPVAHPPDPPIGGEGEGVRGSASGWHDPNNPLFGPDEQP
jgi:hypothetical protein